MSEIKTAGSHKRQRSSSEAFLPTSKKQHCESATAAASLQYNPFRAELTNCELDESDHGNTSFIPKLHHRRIFSKARSNTEGKNPQSVHDAVGLSGLSSSPELKRSARHGGPDLSDLRGVWEYVSGLTSRRLICHFSTTKPSILRQVNHQRRLKVGNGRQRIQVAQAQDLPKNPLHTIGTSSRSLSMVVSIPLLTGILTVRCQYRHPTGLLSMKYLQNPVLLYRRHSSLLKLLKNSCRRTQMHLKKNKWLAP